MTFKTQSHSASTQPANTPDASINGRIVALNVEARRSLADFVREDLFLTGTHVGCEQGICGACTIERDGRPVRSCLTWAAGCSGSRIRTIEDFDEDDVMIRLREAFSAEHALQCGFCTPGMLITSQDIVRRFAGQAVSDETIRVELSGNLCRCTGYVGIVRAIRRVLDTYSDELPMKSDVRQPGSLTLPDPASVELEQPGTASAERATIRSRDSAGDGRQIESEFELDHSLDTVWSLLRDDLKSVVACLPGAELTHLEDDGSLEGYFNVRLGPVSARIAGKGQARFDDASHTGEVEGQGSDSRSNSRAKGQLGFKLQEISESRCRMTVAITFEMSGALAQFSRGSLVEEIIGLLIEQFQKNLDRHMAGEAPVQSSLGLFALVWMALRRWFRRIFQ